MSLLRGTLHIQTITLLLNLKTILRSVYVSSTKLEIRAEQVLPGSEGEVGESRGRG
jgi:hypothetical protein